MQGKVTTFWSLVKESTITQAFVTFCLIVTLCILWGMGKTVPTDLYQLTVLVVGFWFGSKVGHAQGRIAAQNQAPLAAGASPIIDRTGQDG